MATFTFTTFSTGNKAFYEVGRRRHIVTYILHHQKVFFIFPSAFRIKYFRLSGAWNLWDAPVRCGHLIQEEEGRRKKFIDGVRCMFTQCTQAYLKMLHYC